MLGQWVINGSGVNDCTAAPELIAKQPYAQAVVADKGYDSERIREQIEAKGSKVVIPRKRNSVKVNADLGKTGRDVSLPDRYQHQLSRLISDGQSLRRNCIFFLHRPYRGTSPRIDHCRSHPDRFLLQSTNVPTPQMCTRRSMPASAT